MGAGNYSLIKTVSTGATITAADRNAEHQNHINNMNFPGLDDYSTNLAQMQSTADPYPASVESLATDGSGELERLRYVIKQRNGTSQWYIFPELVTKTADYTATTNDEVILVDATSGVVTITLPTAVGALNKRYLIKKIDNSANAVTVATTSSQYIDEATTKSLPATRDFIEVVSENTNWAITGGLISGITTNTGTQTLTNKTLTTPTIASMANANHDHSDAAGGGTLGAGSITSTALPSGSVVQVVTYQRGDLVTGATTMPYDDTIPQNTEGNELLTLAITPTNSSNKLIIEVQAHIGSPANQYCSGAIFQDATAAALAAGVVYPDDTATVPNPFVLRHTMTAGTTSATTFKFRAGADTGSIYLNGNNTARIFGGVCASSITITEVKA